jgi:hypothetical protein
MASRISLKAQKRRVSSSSLSIKEKLNRQKIILCPRWDSNTGIEKSKNLYLPNHQPHIIAVIDQKVRRNPLRDVLGRCIDVQGNSQHC